MHALIHLRSGTAGAQYLIQAQRKSSRPDECYGDQDELLGVPPASHSLTVPRNPLPKGLFLKLSPLLKVLIDICTAGVVGRQIPRFTDYYLIAISTLRYRTCFYLLYLPLLFHITICPQLVSVLHLTDELQLLDPYITSIQVCLFLVSLLRRLALTTTVAIFR